MTPGFRCGRRPVSSITPIADARTYSSVEPYPRAASQPRATSYRSSGRSPRVNSASLHARSPPPRAIASTSSGVRYGALELRGRLGERAVVAVVATEHRERDEDLARVGDAVARAEVAQVRGDRAQSLEVLAARGHQLGRLVDGHGLALLRARQRPAQGVSRHGRHGGRLLRSALVKVVALAGGVGAGKFLRGLVRAVPAADVTAVVNTGDDLDVHGLRVCPDLDSVTYWLGDAFDRERGWGRRDETFRATEELAALRRRRRLVRARRPRPGDAPVPHPVARGRRCRSSAVTGARRRAVRHRGHDPADDRRPVETRLDVVARRDASSTCTSRSTGCGAAAATT